MEHKKSRIFRLDGDSVEVYLVYDEDIGGYVYNYPDFNDTPRITSSGKRWVNVINSGCPYADKKYGDCGSCEFFRGERPGDCIGICINDKITSRKETEE